jgi:hypothetical protein
MTKLPVRSFAMLDRDAVWRAIPPSECVNSPTMSGGILHPAKGGPCGM